ncbi:BID domain-containing T4SS effector [Bartonella ancashensis]|uniref:Bartonella effector protein BID domain-containing protein n=1 Tax=Bartonella ancashensis TaxID=1318743 RepID=A0A0M4M4Z6_9HYPH|nr:BID domain-containing T4SS effector [Bartonella ancashensis]ALE03029.1 hypothetical protein PU02_0215 [Bartonella ancashensis]ARE31032.1 Bep215 [Bartonella ancashensis]
MGNDKELLIPRARLESLTESSLYRRILADHYTQESLKTIQQLSEVVYGDPTILDTQIGMRGRDKTLFKQLAQKINLYPESIAPLAGSRCFFINNPERVNSRTSIPLLCSAIEKHAEIIQAVEEKIMIQHQRDRERLAHSVKAPTGDLKNFLLSSPEQQKEALLKNPELEKSLNHYMKELDARLSVNEYTAIKNKNYGELAQSTCVSIEQAQKIANIVHLTQKARQQAQNFKIGQAEDISKSLGTSKMSEKIATRSIFK